MKRKGNLLTLIMSLMLTVFLITTFSASASATMVESGTCGENITWTLDDEGVLTISGSGKMSDFSNSSKTPWYSSKTDIISVVIDDGVTSIGGYSFYEFSQLKSVTIGSDVTNIGFGVFVGCTGLESVTIGSGVTNIGDYAFYGCTGLKSITIPDDVKTIGKNAFTGCTGLESVSIGSSVTSIGDSAFSRCSHLKSVILPDSVKSISGWAFNECTDLASATIGNGVESIGEGAFSKCSSLTSITIPDSVTSIGDNGFSNCEKLTYVYLPDHNINRYDNTFFNSPNVMFCCHEDSYWNSYCAENSIKYCIIDEESETSFIIKNQTLKEYCSTKSDVVIPSVVDSVGYASFKDNTVVKNVEIPYCVSQISGEAFANCTALESVIIPFTVTSISSSAFSGTNAKIVCYYNSYAYNYALKNNIPYELITVEFAAENLTIAKNGTLNLGAKPSVNLSSGLPMVFKSSDTSVATVDTVGNVTGTGEGTATISVYTSNGNLLGFGNVAVYPQIYSSNININVADSKTVDYRSNVTVKATATGVDEGYHLAIFIDGKKVADGTQTEVSYTCGEIKGDINYTVKVIDSKGNVQKDADGNDLTKDGGKITCKAGFIQKLIAFFKALFKALPAIVIEPKK